MNSTLIAELHEEVERINAAVATLEPLLKRGKARRRPPSWMLSWLSEPEVKQARKERAKAVHEEE